MTPTPPSATPSSISENHSSHGQYRVVRKRNRVPLSCAPCRNRKLKCNRSSPCENCVKRGDATSCSYAAPGSRKKSGSSSQAATTPDDMQNRIDRLESLVLSLMTNGAQSAGPTAAARALSMSTSSESQEYSPHTDGIDEEMVKDEDDDGESDLDRVAKSLGVLHVNNNKSMYYGEAHWGAILSEISEVRNFFTDHKRQFEEQMVKVEAAKQMSGVQYQGPAFLIGGTTLPQFSELLSNLPGRDAVDKLIQRYFNDFDPTLHILHPPSWRIMYEMHWQDPSKTDPVWLGQLFAIICLTMHSYHRADDEPYEYKGRTLNLAAKYRALTAQCLLLADYSKPVNSLIETMVLHLHGEYARSREAEIGVWVLVGMIVRIAMRMGYHRDPKYYPNITPFQAEMRRRIWAFVRQSDLLFSFQIGLPSMVRLGDCDTELPRNIFDDEFDEDSKVIPPARPLTTATPVSYMIGKASLTFTFGKIIECLQSVRSPTYEEVMKLDHELRETHANLPPHLYLRSMDESSLEPTALLMQRFNVSMLYHKAQCVLHRRFLSRARENIRYAHSRRTCVDSSLELLHHQRILHYNSRPGLRLHSMKWYVNSLTSHDFLLAATLVCLDLWQTAEAESKSRCSGDYHMWGSERRAEMFQAVEMSTEIWLELKDQSMEAYKASELLGLMLKKLRASYAHTQSAKHNLQSSFQYPSSNNSMNGLPQFTPPEDEKPEHSAALTLGMLSTGGITPNPVSMFNGSNPLAPLKSGSDSNIADTQTNGVLSDFLEQPTMNGAVSAPSPFSYLAGNNDPMNMPINLDWEAWDSYIQNTSIDPAIADIWPIHMEMPPPEANGQPPQQLNSTYGNGNAFMGVSTPPGTAM